jgi:hypothetical protein
VKIIPLLTRQQYQSGRFKKWGLEYFPNPYGYLFTAFVGLNLRQSSLKSMSDSFSIEPIAKLKKGVVPAKAGVQKSLKILDSRFRWNDDLGLLQLAL